jgi:hypothetical protein
MLTAGILLDNGQQSLHDKIETLHKLVTQNILPTLPLDGKGYTPEEEFMQIALRGR